MRKRDDFRQSLTARAIDRLLANLGTPVSERIRYLLAAGEYKELVSLKAKPSDYADAKAFRKDYLATSVLRKLKDGMVTGVDTEAAAKASLASCESRNRETNRRLRNGLGSLSTDPEVDAVIFSASRKIQYVLGDFDPDEWFGACRWGPGVSQAVKGSGTHPAFKFGLEADITPSLHELVGDLIKVAYPLWSQYLPKYLTYKTGNEVTFVDKTALTDRSIGIEPGLNLWFQLGIGQMIRRRMKTKLGIDLNSQRENQSGARLGSILGTVVTVDHENASNLNSCGLVRTLVSDDTWFHVMDCARSRYGTLDGVTTRWEMFSSMGNGFTFELETLMFWAIAAASCEVVGCDPCVRVFGDDVVIPTDAYPLYRKASEFMGHLVNESKTFVDGKFRESCGVHFWDGENCAPFYAKETCWKYDPRNAESVRQIVGLHNQLVETARAWGSSEEDLGIVGCRDVVFASPAVWVRNRLPRGKRYVGPQHLGDAVLHVDQFDVLDSPHGLSLDHTPNGGMGWEGFSLKGLVGRPERVDFRGPGLLLAGLTVKEYAAAFLAHFGVDSMPAGNELPLRGHTRYFEKWIWCTSWTQLGPWKGAEPGLC